MGDFRIEVNAVGGHGCGREVQDGGEVSACTSPGCTDCLTARYIEDLRKIASIKDAVIVHWPNSSSAVLDVFVPPTTEQGYQANGAYKRIRRGHF